MHHQICDNNGWSISLPTRITIYFTHAAFKALNFILTGRRVGYKQKERERGEKREGETR